MSTLERRPTSLLRFARLGGALLFFGAASACTDAAQPPMRASSPTTTAQADATDPDNESARQAFEDAYFGEDPTIDYFRYKAKVAQAEAKKLHRTHSGVRGEAATQTPTWANIGPFSGASSPSNDATSADAGRLTAIVTHPTNNQIVYVACDGGVFKSTNADPAASGDWTWTSITDTLPASGLRGNVAVGDLAMSPSDPNTLFLGLGDPLDQPSVGFFISSDGGTTWSAGGSVGTALGIWKIYPISSSVLLVATDSGLFRSTDGGHTFSAIQLGAVPAGYVYSIAGFANGTIVASLFINSGQGAIYYSTNQGQTWTQSTISGNPQAGLDRITLATGGTGTTGYALGALNASLVPGVFKTTDGGHSYAYVTPSGSSFDTGQGSYNQLLTVDPSNSSNVWVGAQVGAYRSTDGGVTWTVASPGLHADYHTATWSKTGTKTLYFGNDGGLAVVRDPLRATIPTTTDLTYVDNRRNRGLATHEIYYLSATTGPVATDARYRVSIGMQDNGTRLRTDSGSGLATSGLFDVVEGGDGFGTLYHPYVPDLVAVSENGNLYIHKYGGSFDQWVSPGPLLFGVPVIADASDPTGNSFFTIGYQAGTSANTSLVYRTHDFGQSFQTISPAAWATSLNAFWVATPRTDASTMAVIGTGAPNNSPGWITKDNGATWTALGAVALFPRSAWFDTNNANVLYVTSVVYDTSAHHLWKSTDKGTTFTALDQTNNGIPFGVPIYLVKNDPFDSNTLYAATELGMYTSADGGASWSRLGAGLPLVSVRDFWEAPDGTMIRVGTYGRGVWELPLARTPNTMSASITAPAASSVSVNSGASVSFTGASSDSSSTAQVTSFWLFGDGATAMGASATHTYVNTTTAAVTYTATFVATDASGANAGATRTITVQPQDDFYLSVKNPNQVCPPPPRLCTIGFVIPPGSSAPGTVSATLIGPDAQTIALSQTATLPAGMTVSFAPASIDGVTTSTMTINVGASVPQGSYTLVVQASSSAGVVHTQNVPVNVMSTSPITNGDFETGSLSGWTAAGTTSVTTTSPHGGKDAAQVGGTAATNGDSSIAQTFTAPSSGGTLSFWYAVHCPDKVTYDWATATLKDTTSNTTTTVLAKTCTNTGAWTQVTSTLTASHVYTLTLVSHDDNYAGDPTYTVYDDVTVGAGAPPPPPQPLVNGTFETGSLSGWTTSGTSATASTASVHGGTYSALLGIVGTATAESSIAQSFTASSTGGTLSFWYLVVCNDTVSYDWATATLKDTTTGTTTTMLAKTCTKTGTWAQSSATLVASHGYTLTLTNHDDNYTGDETHTFFDDVAIK